MPQTLYIKVVSAKDLKSNDLLAKLGTTKLNPYAVVSIGPEKKKTQVKKKNSNPKWNEEFSFTSFGKADVIKVVIMDWKRLGLENINIGDNSGLGEVEIEIKSLLENKTKDERIPLHRSHKHDATSPKERSEKTQGEVHLMIHLASENNVEKPLLQPSVSQGNGSLLVHVSKARDLEAKDRGGTSDPYLELQLADEHYKTSVVEKELNPKWHEDFFFEVLEESSELLVQCWDWNLIAKRSPMGQFRVSIKSLLDGKVHAVWYPLSPQKNEKVKGEIHLHLKYTSAKEAQRNYQIASKHYKELVGLLVTAPDLVIVNLLCKVYESNEVVKSVVNLFNYENRMVTLINQVIYRELKRTKQETTLFRGDSTATKTMTCFLKLCAIDTLHSLMDPFIAEVQANPKGFEIDPEKLPKGENIAANQAKLNTLTTRVLEVILLSTNKWSEEVRHCLTNIRTMVSAVYPNSTTKAVGAFLFLRFICPSLVAPEGFGLLQSPPSKEVRRALGLVSKILLNLANGTRFHKEPYLECFNKFIESNESRLSSFFDELSSSKNSVIEMNLKLGKTADLEKQKITEMGSLLVAINANVAKMEQEMPNDARVCTNPDRLQNNKVIFSKLKEILYSL